MASFLGTIFFCGLCAVAGYVAGNIFPFASIMKRVGK